MSIALICNPEAGRGRGRQVTNVVRKYLVNHRIDHTITMTEEPGHAVTLAARASKHHKTIAALGGDGTISEVLAGMWNSPSTLAIIPGGTGNDYARGLNLPLRPLDALDVALNGREDWMDVGVENDRVFGVMASIGFPVTVMDTVNTSQSRFCKGPTAILAGIWKTLRNLESFPVCITVDDQSFCGQVVGLFVMNMAFGGGGLMFAPQARHNDGQFTVVLIQPISGRELLFTLPKVYRGRHVHHPAVHFLQGKQVAIACDQRQKMFDGDLWGLTPLQAKLVPQATSIMLPKPTRD